MAEFAITANTDPARKALEEMKERAANLEPVLKGQAEGLDPLIQLDSFEAQQTPFGEPWEPLEDVTLEKRRKGSGKVTILVDTGEMRGKVFARATKDSIIYGVAKGATLARARAHLFGTDTAGADRSVEIPVRRFLPMDDNEQPLFNVGPANVWFNKMIGRVRRYITEGKV